MYHEVLSTHCTPVSKYLMYPKIYIPIMYPQILKIITNTGDIMDKQLGFPVI